MLKSLSVEMCYISINSCGYIATTRSCRGPLRSNHAACTHSKDRMDDLHQECSIAAIAIGVRGKVEIVVGGM